MNWKVGTCNIKYILCDNCFPKSLIDKVIRIFLYKEVDNKKDKVSSRADDKQHFLFCLPFLGQYSFRIKHNINKIIK